MLPPCTKPITLSLDPLEVLRRWPADRPVVMLHSGRLDPRWSRWSILAEPTSALCHRDHQSHWIGPPPRDNHALTHDPFLDLDTVTRHDPALYVGHLGYDLARHVETLPTRAHDDHGFPDLQFHRCPTALIHDRLHNQWHLFTADASTPEAHILRTWAERMLPGLIPSDPPFHAHPPRPERRRDEHERDIGQALDYIAAGDVFQVNLAQRFSSVFEGNTRTLFRRLATHSPAWYGAYLELLGDESPVRQSLCSTSPELFLKLDADGHVTTRPIKGTRPAHDDPRTLIDSAKDAAELNMIIDLLRNDLGRVCDYGSVRVTQPRTVETHPTVHHGVATVTGRLHRSRSLRHLLRATFPGGSVTGAPKVRAMQIIEELEPVRRGPYCGAIGYIHGGPHRTMQLNVAIRTILLDRQTHTARFSVGGGIVADSTPTAEYDETLDKATVLIAALGG